MNGRASYLSMQSAIAYNATEAGVKWQQGSNMIASLDISVTEFKEHQAEAVVNLWRSSMEKAIGVPPLHSIESQTYFLKNILPQNYTIFVAIDIHTKKLIGFMASNVNTINQLYIDVKHQNKGAGSKFIELAKKESNGELQLRTFEVNKNAQKFYEKHGFRASNGDCNNEEGLQDIIFTWSKT